MAIGTSAQELLGAEFAPPPRLFTPVDLGGGMTATDRYRHMVGLTQEENAVSKMLAERSLIENSYLKAERSNQAMLQEKDVLSELNKIDPLSEDFEQRVGQFAQMASLSPAVAGGVDNLLDKRNQYNTVLGALGESAVQAGLDPETFASQQATAMDLLSRGDHSELRRIMAINQRLGESRLIKNQKDNFLWEQSVRDKSAKERQNQSFAAQYKAGVAAQQDKTLDRVRTFRNKQISLLKGPIPTELLTDDFPLGDSEITIAQWIENPNHAPEMVDMPAITFTEEDASGRLRLPNGEIDEAPLKAAGASPEAIKAYVNGDIKDLVIPQRWRAEAAIAHKLVNDQILKHVVGSGEEPLIENIQFVEDAMGDADLMGEAINHIASAALSMDEDAFMRVFSADTAELEGELAKTLSTDEGRKTVMEARMFMGSIGLTPSTKTQSFLKGLHKSVSAIREMASLRTQIREEYSPEELERAFGKVEEEEIKEEIRNTPVEAQPAEDFVDDYFG